MSLRSSACSGCHREVEFRIAALRMDPVNMVAHAYMMLISCLEIQMMHAQCTESL